MTRPTLTALLLLIAAALPAQTTPPSVVDTPPPSEPAMTAEQAAKLLEQITRTRDEFAKTKKQVFESALTRFRAASDNDTDAANFYLAAYQVVNIDRKPATSKDEQQSRDKGEWRKRLLEQWKDNPRQATVFRLQLQLLVLTMEAMQEEDRTKMIAPLRAYTQSVLAALQASFADEAKESGRRVVASVGNKGRREEMNDNADRGRQRMRSGFARGLTQSVMGTIFADAYNLTTYIDKLDGWPTAPLDLRTTYREIILPHCRLQKRGLAEAWQEYLNAETILKQAETDEAGLLAWGQSGYKELQWEKWLDLLMNGVNANTAGEEMMKMIRENPTSPSLKKWMADLGGVMEKLGAPAPTKPEAPAP